MQMAERRVPGFLSLSNCGVLPKNGSVGLLEAVLLANDGFLAYKDFI